MEVTSVWLPGNVAELTPTSVMLGLSRVGHQKNKKKKKKQLVASDFNLSKVPSISLHVFVMLRNSTLNLSR